MAASSESISRLVAAALVAAVIPLTSTAPASGVEHPVVFCDVSNDTYYADAVAWAGASGITTGVTDIRFAPNAPTTRGQIITFLFRFVTWQQNGSPPASDGPDPFTDVVPGAYYERPVRWALAAGVTTGKSPTSFDPDGPATRGELSAFIHRLLGAPDDWPVTDHFVDIDASSFAPEISWMYDTGLTTGTGPDTFSPERVLSRAEVVTFLWRLAGRPGAEGVDPGCVFTAVGDSVMLGAALYAGLGPDRYPGWTGTVDVGVCRMAVIDLVDVCVPGTIPSVLSVVRAAAVAGTLGDVVVIHVGTNDSTFDGADFDQLVEAAASAAEIYFVSVQTRNAWEATVNAVIRDGVARWQGRRPVGLLDWEALTLSTSGLLASDGTHVSTPAGALAFVDLIGRALDG